MSLFTGSGVAIVTPFNEDFTINFEALYRLLDFHIENGTDAIIIGGTTGETSTMGIDEHIGLVEKCCTYVDGRLPVIAGTGSNCTNEAIELSVRAEKAGADGVLVVNPYYNKGNSRGIYKHYEMIAEKVNVPILLYNVPSRTGMNMPVDLVVELAEIPNIVGIKEASGNISYASEIARRCPEGFDMYSGNDDIILPLLSLGGKGVISVIANIMPQETHDIIEKFMVGDIAGSRKLQLGLNGFVDSLFIEANPIPIKKAMELCGHETGPLRLPLYEMSEEATAVMVTEMEKVGLKPVVRAEDQEEAEVV